MPDEKGIQLTGIEVEGRGTTKAAIVLMQRIGYTSPDQAQYIT
ncbi:hypothetical protein [Candidatus Nitrosocosmicus franklandus]|uniref:Uncharacterized protein n=1 Tax=Candidatus Nitrosocosmicus franklandianus TaxID=1798806 RepID=A0A484IGH8_9ARCH|nr:hypothetical protein [Candidatus Nitrosocosmicus franklandus]VFJ15112.1 protein of unknown function [Candidatus Nitrosocosmicus franklandus]